MRAVFDAIDALSDAQFGAIAFVAFALCLALPRRRTT